MKKIWKKVVTVFLVFQGMILGLPMQVLATEAIEAAENSDGGALKNTKLYNGTMRLFADATKVAMLIETGICAFLVIKEFIAMQQADEQEKPRHKKNIKTIILSGVIILCMTGLLTAVFSYYQ